MELYRNLTGVPYDQDVIMIAHTETIFPFAQGKIRNSVFCFDCGGHVLFAFVTDPYNDVENAARYIRTSRERIYKFTYSTYYSDDNTYCTIEFDGIRKEVYQISSQLGGRYINIPGLKDVVKLNRFDPNLIHDFGPIMRALGFSV